MTVFTEPWFLDAVAPGKWIEVIAQDGAASARFVVVRRRLPFGRLSLGHAPLLVRLGPEYSGMDEKVSPESRLSLEHRLQESIIEQLPAFDDFIVSIHWHTTNVMPFAWAGFDLRWFYTYVLDDLSDLEAVWESFSTRARRSLRKAERSVTVSEGDAEQLYELLLRTYDHQGRAARYPLATLRRVVEGAYAHDQGRVLLAADESGAAHASLLVIWDPSCAYYLVGGSDPALRSSGAMSLLMREAIRLAAAYSKQFDFEGSMNKGIEYFLRSFGARQAPHVQVAKASRLGKMMRTASRLARLRGATASVGDWNS